MTFFNFVHISHQHLNSLTLSNKIASVSMTAAFTFPTKRSPTARISGPVMATTLTCNDSLLDNLMASPNPKAPCSLTSVTPFNIASLKIGISGRIPCKVNTNEFRILQLLQMTTSQLKSMKFTFFKQNPGKIFSLPSTSWAALRIACLTSATTAIC